MIVKVDKNNFTQKCEGCGKLHSLSYSDFVITANFITLHPCDGCGSLEVLCNNNLEDDHSVKVSKVFANIATQG